MRIIGVIKRQLFFSHGNAFSDNSSHTRDFCHWHLGSCNICSLEHGRKHMLIPGFHYIVTGSWNRAIQACFSSLHEGLWEFMTKNLSGCKCEVISVRLLFLIVINLSTISQNLPAAWIAILLRSNGNQALRSFRLYGDQVLLSERNTHICRIKGCGGAGCPPPPTNNFRKT